MPNKNFFLYSKLFHNLKSYKLIIVCLLLIVLIIVFFINTNSLLKIVEGNKNCKFTKKDKIEKDVRAKSEKYKKDLPNQDDSKTKLGRVGDIKSKVDTKSIKR